MTGQAHKAGRTDRAGRTDEARQADRAGRTDEASRTDRAGLRVLVLRALGIGDLATALPALRGLRAGLPHAQLTLAAPDWLAPLVELTDTVDRLLPHPNLDTPLALEQPPDLAVNLHGCGPQSHRLLAATRPGRLLAHAGQEFPDGPAWHAEEHEVRRWCRLLWWYGMPADPTNLALRAPTEQVAPAGVTLPAERMAPAGPAMPTGVTIVHPGAKDPARRWPVERFAAVAMALAQAGHQVVVTGSAAERELTEPVTAGLPDAGDPVLPPDCAGLATDAGVATDAGLATGAGLATDAGLATGRDLAGRLSLSQLAALVAGARLVVSADTGIGHLATAYGVASVVLFGPTSPRMWGPLVDQHRHRVLWHAQLPPQSRLPAITVPEVLNAADAALTADLGRLLPLGGPQTSKI